LQKVFKNIVIRLREKKLVCQNTLGALKLVRFIAKRKGKNEAEKVRHREESFIPFFSKKARCKPYIMQVSPS
jgi:hypothetical protein